MLPIRIAPEKNVMSHLLELAAVLLAAALMHYFIFLWSTHTINGWALEIVLEQKDSGVHSSMNMVTQVSMFADTDRSTLMNTKSESKSETPTFRFWLQLLIKFHI